MTELCDWTKIPEKKTEFKEKWENNENMNFYSLYNKQ